MKLTAHEEYGFRCLLRIAWSGPGGSLTIGEISEAEHISSAHAAKLLRILRRARFVKSVRGKIGGYSLALPANQIVVGDVLAALGGRLFDADFCESHSGQGKVCAHSMDCSLRTLWQTVQLALDQVLGKTTLQDLLQTEEATRGWVNTLGSLKAAGLTIGPPAA